MDVWLNGSIFAGHRAKIEAWRISLSELMGCSLCLNYQTAIWFTCGLWVLPMFVPGWAALVLRGLLVAWLWPASVVDQLCDLRS